jgi:hypothetical protein
MDGREGQDTGRAPAIQARIGAISADRLMAKALPPVRHIVPGTSRRASSFWLAARNRGKSWLCLGLASGLWCPAGTFADVAGSGATSFFVASRECSRRSAATGVSPVARSRRSASCRVASRSTRTKANDHIMRASPMIEERCGGRLAEQSSADAPPTNCNGYMIPCRII